MIKLKKTQGNNHGRSGTSIDLTFRKSGNTEGKCEWGECWVYKLILIYPETGKIHFRHTTHGYDGVKPLIENSFEDTLDGVTFTEEEKKKALEAIEELRKVVLGIQ